MTGFLHADVEYDPRVNVTYELRNPGAFDAQQFFVLARHFEKLDLSARYTRQASTVLARLIKEFRRPNNLDLGRERLRLRLIQMAADRVTTLPPNHWEAALIDVLVASDKFVDHIFN